MLIRENNTEYVVLDTAVPSQRRYHDGAVTVGHKITAPVGFPQKSHHTALFFHFVIDVTTHAEDTMTPSFAYCTFHADVDVCIAPDESIIIYVVFVAPTVTVPPTYCHSVPHTRYVPAPIRTTSAPSVESLYSQRRSSHDEKIVSRSVEILLSSTDAIVSPGAHVLAVLGILCRGS